MSEGADRLARSRLAILEHLHQKERPPGRKAAGIANEDPATGYEQDYENEAPAARRYGGWFGRIQHVTRTWWRHHPGHMALELATPTLSDYARRKPVQFLGIAAALGALVVIARPWKLMSATGLLVAVLKSSQLSGLVMSAMSAAEYERDDRRLR